MGMNTTIYLLLGGDDDGIKVWYLLSFKYGYVDNFFLWEWVWNSKLIPLRSIVIPNPNCYALIVMLLIN